LLPLFTALKKGFDLARLSMAGTPVSAHDNATLLAFPESFVRLEEPLRVFLTSLCEPNAYFTPATLGGVWFTASEQQDKNKSSRTTSFVHDLLTYHLPAFSMTRDVQWYHNRKLRVVAGRLLLLGCVVAQGYSALKSTELMQHDTAALSPAELADVLLKNETHRNTPLVYLPFAHVLNHQHLLIEARLREKLPSQLLNIEPQFSAYEQQFLAASLPTQREMVLSLAQTVLTRQAMRDDATLAALSTRPVIPDALRLDTVGPSASPLARLALERLEMQQPAGASHLAALHRLLSALINDDRTLAWLTAPDDNLPDIQANYFWPQNPDAATLSGIWTRQGEAQLTKWVGLITQAGGTTQAVAALQQFMQALPALRQNAWRELLFTVIPSLQNQVPHSLSHNQLIAIGQGQSPAMQFAKRIALELDDIPAQSAQPWLTELQRLQVLTSQAAENSALRKVQRVDAILRGGLTKWLRGGKLPAAAHTSTPQTGAWQKWQAALNAAASQALNQAALSPALTNGLFAPQTEANNINPLVTLFASFEQLRKTPELDSQEMGVDAVWLLYQSDASALLGHALSRSGCWLNEQWQSKVLWPMRKNAQGLDYDAQKALTWQYLTDFVRGPAKGLLVVTDQGPQAGEFRDLTLPLTEEFVSIARHLLNPEDVLDVPQRQNTQNADRISVINDQITQLTQQQKALETKPYSISIVSQPATVPEGARLIPTGSRLTLECQSGVKVLDSMNFAEEAQFVWQPGQCQSVKLDVKFPNFTATYRYTGNSAWPAFLDAFVHGEALIDARDFDDNADTMTELNIKHVLLRFKITNQTALQTAWIDWSKLDDQLAGLKEQKQALEEQQQSLEPSAALRGRLSGLPENAADCR
jgi:type VI secretion system protein ImpL